LSRRGVDLPGKPDLVFRSRRKAIFVHGCFWRQHTKIKCLDGRRPKSNSSYWNPKLEGNVARDKRNQAALKGDVLVIWDCETQSPNLKSRIEKFLGPVR
jgi:DNA mismatch endonuclease (patch repair protein)